MHKCKCISIKWMYEMHKCKCISIKWMYEMHKCKCMCKMNVWNA